MSTAENGTPEGISKVTQFWAALPDQDGVNAALWRVPEKGAPEFLDTYFLTKEAYPDEYAFYAEVKAEHGGGKYELRVTTTGGQWVSKPAFCIGGKPKRQDADEGRQQGQQSELALLMARMDENQRRADERHEKLLERLADKSSDKDELDRLERFNSIVNRSAQPPVEKEKSLIEQAVERRFLAFMDSELGGGGGDEGFGWVKDLVGQFGSAMGPALAGAVMQAGQGGQAAPAATITAPVDAQAQMMGKLKLLLMGMVQLAEYKVPPENTVAKIQEQAGAYWPNLLNVIQREDAVAIAAKLVPAVTAHREWFEGFRAAALGQEQGEDGGGTGSSDEQPAPKRAGKRPARAKVAG